MLKASSLVNLWKSNKNVKLLKFKILKKKKRERRYRYRYVRFLRSLGRLRPFLLSGFVLRRFGSLNEILKKKIRVRIRQLGYKYRKRLFFYRISRDKERKFLKLLRKRLGRWRFEFLLLVMLGIIITKKSVFLDDGLEENRDVYRNIVYRNMDDILLA